MPVPVATIMIPSKIRNPSKYPPTLVMSYGHFFSLIKAIVAAHRSTFTCTEQQSKKDEKALLR